MIGQPEGVAVSSVTEWFLSKWRAFVVVRTPRWRPPRLVWI